MDYKKVHEAYLDIVENYKDDLINICKNNHQIANHNMHESLIYNLMTYAYSYSKSLDELEMIGLILAGYCYYMNFEINETI